MRLLCSVLAVMTSTLAAANFPAPDALPANPALPDPLTMQDGTKVSTKEDWSEKRAPELRGLFMHFMYGARPQQVRPVEGKVVREDKEALGGKATLREVDVNAGLEAPVHLLIVIPNHREKPAACFLGINFNGNYQLLPDPKIPLPQNWTRGKATDELRGKERETWSIEQTIDRGYAVASFYYGDIVPDDAALAEPILRKFDEAAVTERQPAGTAAIMAWAWGCSTMRSYLESLPEIDGKRIAVVGHSRLGKTALLAAAMDPNFAMAIPSQAGCGGTAPNRASAELAKPGANGRPTVETVPVINKSFPHWFCGNFKGFNEAVEKLPFDQHELIALCAPRPVLVSNAEEDLWANPTGQYAMLRAAAPVYALFDDQPALPAERPAINELHNERLGYFIRPGKHSMTALDWKNWLDYADKWLK